ncbi:MAG: serine/threonine-protein kinase RsbW [Actinomycetota bacterium]|nr:anti-sigma regulatory factor [Cryptosporangiaceae bacterium]MDQ1676883.1 serine/threonine-protein kinase RsbW [Actinomycetota bacterium]
MNQEQSSERAAAGATGTVASDVVVLTIPAAGAYLSVLRTATAGLAARLDFTLDEIEDLRIAVDEACGMLLPGTAPGTELRCAFSLDTDRIGVEVSVPAGSTAAPSRETFAWTVLSALAGEVNSHNTDGRIAIRLVKRRGRPT